MALLKHSETGTVHTLGTRCLVGRAGYCLVRISNPYVSAEHATLMWTGAEWRVKDLGSRNGTFVNFSLGLTPGTPEFSGYIRIGNKTTLGVPSTLHVFVLVADIMGITAD